MKKLLFLLLFPIYCFGQGSKLVSNGGSIVSISPGTTITQASPATVFFTENIPAGVLLPNKWYHLQLWFKLTTPIVSIPGISVTFQYGSSTFNLMTGAALVGGVTNGLFRVNFYMVSTATNVQIPFAEILQPNGSLITLSASTVSPVGSFATNTSVDNTFSCTIQFTGTSLGTSSLNNFWVLRDPI